MGPSTDQSVYQSVYFSYLEHKTRANVLETKLWENDKTH